MDGPAATVPRSSPSAGIDLAEITAIANCHLHLDHSGQNALFPGVPIYVQPAGVGRRARARLHDPRSIDFPGADYEHVAGDHEVAPGIRIFATPGHSPGHQSLVVETPDGPSCSPARRSTATASGPAIPGAREGAQQRRRTSAAYARSVARLRALEPEAGPLRARPSGLAD